jgi:KaiC/GvpD/RAD55 family RecA-like ATPase
MPDNIDFKSLIDKQLLEEIEASKKFIDIIDVDDLEVWTESGFIKIESIGKTVLYEVYTLKLDNGLELEGADNHIVMTLRGPVYMKNLIVGYDVVLTKNGKNVVDSITHSSRKEHMYDLQLASNIKRYTLKNNKEDRYSILSSNIKCTKYASNILKDDKILVNDDYKVIDSIYETENEVILEIDLNNHTYYTNDILSHNTLFLTQLTSDFIKGGKSILYITLEMSEFEINKRIDANLLRVPIADFIPENRDRLAEKFIDVTNAIPDLGKLKTVEYPSSSCSVNTIKSLLKQLEREESFIPDVIMVDQINTMADIENSPSTYLKIKNIVEGLKAISMESDVVIISASQANRETIKQKEDIDMTNIAESMTIAQIADVIIGLKSIEKTEAELSNNEDARFTGLVRCNVIKSRQSGTNHIPFTVELDFRYMEIRDK